MRKLRMAATVAAAASALVLTSAGISSAAQVHQASPAIQPDATLAASTTTSGNVYITSSSCSLSLNAIYAIACATGAAADMLQAEMAIQASQLNGAASSSSFTVTVTTGNGVKTWTLWETP